jgi:hypothetical protein
MVSNANIGDTGDAVNSPEPGRRSLRSLKPTAKVRETLISTESKAQPTKKTPGTTVRPAGAPTLDGRTSVAQRLLIDVCETRQNIKDLKLVIQQQTEILVKLSTELVSVKTELVTVKTELSEVKQQVAEELKHVYERLDTISNSPALTITTALTSPNPSYANVARTPPNSSPANLNSISSMETTPSTMTDSLFCTIDTSRVESRVESREDERISVGAIRRIVEKEIRGMEGRVNWRCRAVTKDPKNANRIRIACRDEIELGIVKQVAEGKIAPGTRVLRDELYPIKVDNVNRLAVLDDEGNIRTGAAEAFSQENETTVAKIAWLSRKDTAKAYGSMVVYVTKGSDARRLLNEGFFHAGGESGYTRVFERRLRTEQCYNCQEIGHKAFSCKKAQVCAKCAKQGHHHSECKETVVKCVLCGGPHESFSQNCQKLYPTSQKQEVLSRLDS